MNGLTSIVAVGALLVSSAGAAPHSLSPAPAPSGPASPVPLPAGTVSSSVPAPDEAEEVRVRLLVRATHEWAQGALSDARFRLEALKGALEQGPVAVDAVEVDELRLEPVVEEALLPARPRAPRDTEVVGYRAVVPVTVLSDDPGDVGLLVQVAEGAGAELDAASSPDGAADGAGKRSGGGGEPGGGLR